MHESDIFIESSFPRAILHVDGDSFFASCEIAKDPSLRGKPIVTGFERGIATSMSYEAKALGISRGMRVSDIRKNFPSCAIVDSDYDSYAIYADRMYAIVKRYTPIVEEYSIDECFADLTGQEEVLGMSYDDIARKIQKDLLEELDLNFTIGLSVNKLLAKVASKWKKPRGFTVINGLAIPDFLKDFPIHKLWGIGGSSAQHMKRLGITTAFDLATKRPLWVKENLSKPYQEIQRELRGFFVNDLNVGSKKEWHSIMRTNTFRPPSRDRDFVFSELSKNVEEACAKLRRNGFYTKEISFFLKTQDFRYFRREVTLSHAACVPQEILKAVQTCFDDIFDPRTIYRATGITLRKLSHEAPVTDDLFGYSRGLEKLSTLYEAIDSISRKQGKAVLHLGSSQQALHHENGVSSTVAQRRMDDIHRLGIPLLGFVT